MTHKRTYITMLRAGADHPKSYRTAVSLHSHSRHSKEGLDFVPEYASRIPVICSFFNRARERYHRVSGKIMDFAGWYWTPPLTLQTVRESETERIEQQLGLRPMVSVTDHNNISRLGSVLGVDDSLGDPISLEWTAPFDGAVLHLGIHNLPPEASTQIVKELALYRHRPKESKFGELLDFLNDDPETLVVLNHPLSDVTSLGRNRLRCLIARILGRHAGNIHALEINGYRPWNENHATLRLAERFDLPVVSGGDRHGRAPNAVLNLTNSAIFSGFVSEIRYDKVSEILLMPEYGEDLFKRRLESVADFFRLYPEYPRGFQRWTDRVFIQVEEDVVRPLSDFWENTVPLWVKSAMWMVQLVRSKYIQPALRMTFAKKMRAHSGKVSLDSLSV